MNKIITILVAFFTAATIATAQPIGIQLYSLQKELRADLHGTLSLIASWGISDVEISENYGLSNTELRVALDSHKLKAVSVPADFATLETDPMAIVRMAKELGTANAVCYWTPHPLGQFAEVHIQKAVTVFNTAGKILANNGIQLCYHPHWYEFDAMGSGTFFDYLAINTDEKFLQFELDIFWIQFAGKDPLSVMSQYAGRTPIIHLKDRMLGSVACSPDKAHEQNAALGSGMIDIKGIVKLARNNKELKYLIIEDESSQPLVNIPAGIQFLTH